LLSCAQHGKVPLTAPAGYTCRNQVVVMVTLQQERRMVCVHRPRQATVNMQLQNFMWDPPHTAEQLFVTWVVPVHTCQ
jgi:hypothetical protein